MKWNKCDQTWEEFQEEHAKGLDPLPTGLCFMDSAGEMHLIGDVNVLGGICDDCRFYLDTGVRVVAWGKIKMPDKPMQ